MDKSNFPPIFAFQDQLVPRLGKIHSSKSSESHIMNTNSIILALTGRPIKTVESIQCQFK